MLDLLGSSNLAQMLASRAPAAGMEDHRQHLKPVTSYRPASSAAPSRSRSQQASKPPISKAAPCSTTAVATGTSNARQPSQSANNVPPTSVAPTKQATARPDKAKLTEQWGPPPDLIQRGQQDWLTRGHLLGEVSLGISCNICTLALVCAVS